MRGRLSWVGAVPHVVITVLMVVVIVDMLVGVFLRYVMMVSSCRRSGSAS